MHPHSFLCALPQQLRRVASRAGERAAFIASAFGRGRGGGEIARGARGSPPRPAPKCALDRRAIRDPAQRVTVEARRSSGVLPRVVPGVETKVTTTHLVVFPPADSAATRGTPESLPAHAPGLLTRGTSRDSSARSHGVATAECPRAEAREARDHSRVARSAAGPSESGPPAAATGRTVRGSPREGSLAFDLPIVGQDPIATMPLWRMASIRFLRSP
jgi:hypothetical protein